jgi:hypothetical protein
MSSILAGSRTNGPFRSIEQDLRFDDRGNDALAPIELSEVGGDEGEGIYLRGLCRQRQ